MPDAQLVLLYDGVCGFCDGVVQFILARDRRGTMRFAPLQGEFARGVFARYPELRDVDSLICIRDGSALSRSEAILSVGRYLGGGWRLAAAMLGLIPRFLRDAAYDTFARRRYRLFGKYDACSVPSPDQRQRFLP